MKILDIKGSGELLLKILGVLSYIIAKSIYILEGDRQTDTKR